MIPYDKAWANGIQTEVLWTWTLSKDISWKMGGKLGAPSSFSGWAGTKTSIGEPHYKSNRQKVPGSLNGLHLPHAVWLALVCERENVFYLLVFWSFFVYTDLAYMPKCPAPLHYFPNIPWIFLPSTLVHAKASVVNILPPHLRYLNSPQRLSSNSPSSAMLGLAPLVILFLPLFSHCMTFHWALTEYYLVSTEPRIMLSLSKVLDST